MNYKVFKHLGTLEKQISEECALYGHSFLHFKFEDGRLKYSFYTEEALAELTTEENMQIIRKEIKQ